MTDILVKPQELRQAAEQLRASAKKISGATGNVVRIFRFSEFGMMFSGNRSLAVFVRFMSRSGEISRFDDLVVKFANDLEQTANRFETADKNESSSNTKDGVKYSEDLQNLKDEYYKLEKELDALTNKYSEIDKKIKELNNSIGEGAIRELAHLLAELERDIGPGKFASLLADIHKFVEDPLGFGMDKLIGKIADYAGNFFGLGGRIIAYLVTGPGFFAVDVVGKALEGYILHDERDGLVKDIETKQKELLEINSQIQEYDPTWYSGKEKEPFVGGGAGGGTMGVK